MSKSKKSAAEMRQSQVLSTFGPGSMMDLPNHAVLMGGLNHWQGYQNQPIYEDRLAQRLAEILGVTKVSMYAPRAKPIRLLNVPELKPSSSRFGLSRRSHNPLNSQAEIIKPVPFFPITD